MREANRLIAARFAKSLATDKAAPSLRAYYAVHLATTRNRLGEYQKGRDLLTRYLDEFNCGTDSVMRGWALSELASAAYLLGDTAQGALYRSQAGAVGPNYESDVDKIVAQSRRYAAAWQGARSKPLPH